MMVNDGMSLTNKQKISTSVAYADILLSIMSATAVSSEYPKSLIDSESEDALGGNLNSVAI